MNDNHFVNVVIKKDFFVKSRKDNIKDQFEFMSVLGKGAYGTVYKAKEKEYPNLIRAIKVIKKKSIKNQQALIDEVTILRECDHPSIVKLYETFEDEQYLCMVMDFCEGGQLFGRLEQQGSFSERDARDVFSQMAKIVKYMHSNHICHRDLKPENFLMYNRETLELKLTDFGLSTKWQNDLRKELKQAGKNKILGTSYYIAPEVLSKDYDEKCDIWSLGVLLYILVSASPPFDGKDDNEILECVQKLKYSLDIPEMKSVSPQLKDLIKKILVPANQRLTVDEILSHPWMVGKSYEVPLKLDFSKMRQFGKFSRFKTVVMAYIASQLPQKQIHALGQAFKQVDKNSDGYLTIDELKEIIQKQHQNISYQDLKDLINSIDTDHNGKINYNEFIASCLQSSYLNNEKYLKHIFNYFDINKDGSITRDQFKSIIKQSGIQQYQDRNIEEIIDVVDINKDGRIDYEEFLKGMRKV